MKKKKNDNQGLNGHKLFCTVNIHKTMYGIGVIE